MMPSSPARRTLLKGNTEPCQRACRQRAFDHPSARPRLEGLEDRCLPATTLPGLPANDYAANYVTKLYEDALHREPSLTDVASWSDAFRACGAPYVAQGILVSPEAHDRLRETFSTNYFGKSIDADPWKARFSSQWLYRWQMLIAMLIEQSPEFQISLGNPRDLVGIVYHRMLTRDAEPSSVNSWLPLASTNPGAFVSEVAQSEEAAQRMATRLYEESFHREPESAALRDYWGHRLQNENYDFIKAQFLASPEYFNDAQPSDAPPASLPDHSAASSCRVDGIGAELSHQPEPQVTFVGNLYLDLLHRAPDPAGLASWSNAVTTCGTRYVAQGILVSTEVHERLREDFSTRYFTRFLSEDFWRANFSAHWPLRWQALVATMLGSQELFDSVSDNPDALVHAVYLRVLGREAQPEEVHAWQLLASTDRTQFASAVVDSPEAAQWMASRWYEAYLNREPESAAVKASWGQQLQNGNYDDLKARLLSSAEYFLKGQPPGTPLPNLDVSCPLDGVGGDLSHQPPLPGHCGGITLSDSSSATVSIATPQQLQVVQRHSDNVGSVIIQGDYAGPVTCVEARAVPLPGASGNGSDWRRITLDGQVANGLYAGSLSVPAGGWYRIDIQAFNGYHALGGASVAPVGVGDLFVTAGQSNSTNSGFPPERTSSGMVVHWDGAHWSSANDPQPIADGTMGGSPWPLLGDMLAAYYHLPIGFVSLGWGATSLRQWMPNADPWRSGPTTLPQGFLYQRLSAATQSIGIGGIRAVLWHQGEGDTAAQTPAETYHQMLSVLINQVRSDAGYPVDWFVAHASYPGSLFMSTVCGTPANPHWHECLETISGWQAQVRMGQSLAVDNVHTFPGPDTDDLTGPAWRRADADVHFNDAGLHEHARRWFAAITSAFA